MRGFLYGQTEYNILNNTVHTDDYFKACLENKHQFISITDSNLYNSYKFYNKAIELGLKPIIGIEYSYIGVDNLESKLVPNIYFIGEVLNVDGLSGGYNIHFAISSALWLSSKL